MLRILSFVLMVSSLVKSTKNKTLFLSDSSCSTYYSVNNEVNYYLTWNGTLLHAYNACRITFHPEEYILSVCVETKFFHVEDCSVRVNFYGKTEKNLKCNSQPIHFCGSQYQDIGIELLSRSTNPLHGSNFIQFKILSLLSMLSETVNSEKDKTLFFSDSLCASLYNTDHSVEMGDEYYLTWNGTLLPLSKGCKIHFHPKDSLSVCVEVEVFHLDDCSVEVNFYGKIEKKYKCSRKPERFCGSQNEDIDIELFSRSTNPLFGSNAFRFKIHVQEVPVSIPDYVWINVGLISLVIVTVGIILTCVGLCRRARKGSIVLWRSEIPHTRMVDSEDSDQPRINFEPVPEVSTTEFTIPDTHPVNTE